MILRPRRFVLEMDGLRWVGIAFEDEGALEEFLLDRGHMVVVEPPTPTLQAAPDMGQRGRGRPSSAAVVQRAIASLTLGDFAGCANATAVARRVQARAATMSGDAVSLRTVIDHLGARTREILAAVGGEKSGEKSKCATDSAQEVDP